MHEIEAAVFAYSPSLHAVQMDEPSTLYSPVEQSTGVAVTLSHFFPNTHQETMASFNGNVLTIYFSIFRTYKDYV